MTKQTFHIHYNFNDSFSCIFYHPHITPQDIHATDFYPIALQLIPDYQFIKSKILLN